MEKDFTILIEDRYRLIRKIGEGGMGLVYLGSDLVSKEQVAIKLEHTRHGFRKLEGEVDAYKTLAGGTGIPRVLWFGQECDYYVLVLDLLGPSLEDLFNYCDRRFSLKTVLLLVDQLITRIEHIHSKQGNTVYAVDFGLAEDYRTTKHRGQDEGTYRYASINFHNCIEQYRRDDLESLGYVLVYFFRGSLPWQGLKVAKGESKKERIKEMKTNTSVGELCEGLPIEFETYIKYCRSLGADVKPDYRYLRGLFRGVSKRHRIDYDNVFDWTVKKYIQDHSELDKPVSSPP